MPNPRFSPATLLVLLLLIKGQISVINAVIKIAIKDEDVNQCFFVRGGGGGEILKQKKEEKLKPHMGGGVESPTPI